MKSITIEDAFEIIITPQKIEIDRQWLAQYKKTEKYNELEWYYALSKRLRAYNLLTNYIQQNYKTNSKSPLLSSPTKTPIDPAQFFNSLGDPELEYITFITCKICAVYIQYGVIQECDINEFISVIHKETLIGDVVDFTNTSDFRSDPPPKSPHHLQREYFVINKNIAEMIHAIISLSQNDISKNHHNHINTITRTRFIDNEDDTKKSKLFALDLCKYVTSIGGDIPLKYARMIMKKRSEHLRELAYHDDRIHFISTCVDILTGGILNVKHDIREFKHDDDDPIDYITDEYEYTLYKLPIVSPRILETLFTQDIINSINIYSTEEERKKVIEKITTEINTNELNSENPKRDIFGRLSTPPSTLTGNEAIDKILTTGWAKELDNKNEDRFVSAWCNITLTWPDDIIINNFSAWLKRIKKQYNPRTLGKQEIDSAGKRSKKFIAKINNKKLLQYLDIKILSAATGSHLIFAPDTISIDGAGEFKDIATKNSSPDRNELLEKIFSFDEESDALRDLWLLGLV